MVDAVQQAARADLLVEARGVPPDLFVWDHALRVMRSAELIASLPEVAQLSVDRSALAAATLYHEAGWVLQLRAGEIGPHELLLRPTSDLMRELAADLAAKRLKGVIPPGSLELATRGIRECNDRATGLIEAQLLAEADHLEEIGPQAIRLMERKNRSEGKTLDDLIATWERQEEYHYWQARIKESFRFPSVRRLAERRLDALRRFMTDLRAVVRLDDLVALAGTEGNTARARAARD